MITTFNDEAKNIKLSLRQTEILTKLGKSIADLNDNTNL